MSNQSTPDDASREPLDTMKQRNATLSTSVAAAVLQPTEIHNRFSDVKSAIIDLIKNTAWTSNSLKAQQSLLQAVDNLENIPENTAQLSARENTAIEDYMRALEHVCVQLKEASAKYGPRNAGKRDKFKHSWAHLDRSGGVQVLEAGRTDIDAAVNRLRSRQEVQPTEVPIQNVPSSSPSTQVRGRSNLSSNLSIAKTTFDTVETVSQTIPLVGAYIGAAARLGSMIVDMWQGMDSNKEAAKSLEARMAALAEHLEYFKTQPEENQKEETNERIRNLQLQLKFVGEEIEALDSKGAITRTFLSRNNAETLNGFQEQIKAAENEIHRLVSFDTKDLLNKLYGVETNAERRALLDRLGNGSYGAHGDTIEDATCLKGTRETILRTIDEWVHGTSSQRVLWMCGMAGRGKSTVAASVALQCRDRSPWALFHFRRGRSTLEKQLICALAKQLESRGSPEVRHAILCAVRENEDIAQGRLDEQFEALLVNPLKDYPADLSPIILIVDALDECEDITYAARFIELIEKHSPLLPQNIKFILTTRPEPPLVDTLRSKEWEMVNLDQIAGIHHDIELFIRSEFSKIKRLKSRLPVDWPSPDSVQKLVILSEGLFQWASTAVRHIGSGSPDHRLQDLLNDSSTLQGLDNLYRQILSNAFQKAEDNSSVDLLHRALATLVVAPHPISLEVIAYLFMDREIGHDTAQMDSYCAFMRDDVLLNVASLLFIPTSTTEPVQLMHTSIRDLLIDAKRCGNSLYSVNVPQIHWDLAQECLQLMNRDLKKNICDLSDLSKPNSDPDVQACVVNQVPSGLIYCCQSWAIHLGTGQGSGLEQRDSQVIINDLEHLSKRNLLCWLEVMSLIGRVREAMAMTKQAEHQMMQIADGLDILLPTLWSDANRFITEFFEPISFGPLHIYASALPFCPIGTQLWKHYHHQRLAKVLYGQQKREWSANLWTRHLGSHVLGVIFPQGDKILAAGCNESDIYLWDVEKGEQVGPLSEGHFDRVISAAFSPDGRRLASGSWDKTVCLWDVEKRQQIGQAMRGHSDGVSCVALSPHGTRIASGSWDKTVRLWDVETGEQVGQPMEGHTEMVWSVAFSPDGKALASVSRDQTVCLWDCEKGEQIVQPMEGHTKLVCSVAFSPNGAMLASGSADCTVRLWDVKMGKQIGQPMEGHIQPIQSVAFSPDGTRLASGSPMDTVCLWDIEKGEQVGQHMRGHSERISSLAFSPDGRRLASASWDKTVRLWDVENKEQIRQPTEDHTNEVTCVAFSPDGTSLASGYIDGTVHLWDVQKGEQMRQPLEGHTQVVNSVAFSPDGTMLASGSVDGLVYLWNVEMGEQVGQPMEGHTSEVSSLAFSPHGTILASGFWDATVCLWDVKTGEQIGQLMGGHTNGVCCVAFSPDGTRLASGSADRTVCLWDVEMGAQIGKHMQGHTLSVTSVTFSPEGTQLASGSLDKMVCLWDVEKGMQVGKPMQGHTNRVTSVAFLSDTNLASRDLTGQLYCWCLTTFKPLENPQSSITQLCKHLPPNFSPFALEGQWLTSTGSRIIWLPSQFLDEREKTIALSASTLLVAGSYIAFLDISDLLQLSPLQSICN